jgi:hypothetical protein
VGGSVEVEAASVFLPFQIQTFCGALQRWKSSISRATRSGTHILYLYPGNKGATATHRVDTVTLNRSLGTKVVGQSTTKVCIFCMARSCTFPFCFRLVRSSLSLSHFFVFTSISAYITFVHSRHHHFGWSYHISFSTCSARYCKQEENYFQSITPISKRGA